MSRLACLAQGLELLFADAQHIAHRVGASGSQAWRRRPLDDADLRGRYPGVASTTVEVFVRARVAEARNVRSV